MASSWKEKITDPRGTDACTIQRKKHNWSEHILTHEGTFSLILQKDKLWENSLVAGKELQKPVYN